MRNRFLVGFGIVLLFASCLSQKAVVQTATSEKGLSAADKVTFNDLFIDGVRNKNEGNLDMALGMLSGCLEIDSSSTATMFEMAQIYSSQRQINKAIELIELAIEMNPDNKWYKSFLAESYERNRQFNKASLLYDQLIEIDPENVENYYRSGNALAQAGRFKEAIEVLEIIEAKEGASEIISQEKLRMMRLAKMKDEAYIELDKLIELYPTNPQYYLIKAQFCEEDKNDDCAINNYEKLLELNPDMGLVHFSLASFYSQKGDFEKVYYHAKIGLSKPDIDIETKIRLYVLLITNRDKIDLKDEHIEELILKIVQVHPQSYHGYSVYADFLRETNRMDESRIVILKALDLNKNSYPLWEQLVLIDNSLSNFDYMITDTEKALDLFPNQPIFYLLNGIGQLQKENYKEAYDILDAGSVFVIENKALQVQFDYYKAEVSYNLDKSEEAFEAFERVLTQDPENYMAMNNYAYYLSVKGVKLERAKELSKKAIDTEPENATYLDTYAWILFKLEEYNEAKNYMKKALDKGGDDNEVVVEHYGDILYKLNELDEALKLWEKSRAMGNESKILQQKIKEKRFIAENE